MWGGSLFLQPPHEGGDGRELFVQFLGSSQSDSGIDAEIPGQIEISDEFVQEESTQTLGAAAVPGEKSPFHDLRKVDEGENGTIQVREITTENLRFIAGEVLRGVDRHDASR